MPFVDAARAKVYQKNWRQQNPEKVRAHEKRLPTLFALLKAERPCYDCGCTFSSECMDWDHRPGTVKLFSVGDAVARHVKTDLIMEEIAKCDLV